jgi:predicted nucleic acid-binding Zn ribbon protein
MNKAETVLGPMLKQLGIENGVRLERIRNDWSDIFEKSISPHMFPATLKEGELLLHVESPAWMQQLTYYKKEIIRKLSSYSVTDVRFRLGRITKKKQKQEPQKPMRTLSPEEVSFAASVVADIRNEELKDSIRKAIEKSLIADRKPHRDR